MENDLAGLSINEGEEEAWQFHDGSDMQPELFDLCLILDLGEMGYLFRFYNRVDIDRVVKGASWTFNNHLLEYDPKQISSSFKQCLRIKMSWSWRQFLSSSLVWGRSDIHTVE
ncbi:hypothetical protein Gohar_004057 [Gossypium harknessii]|uniref:DUF4283 domain-containing protein n=1 Tax=Gossypium harknessii TaxID=34285 RepID=A0A7J9H529_9ROSI|nr:hypothetical protein [Gossypium harknessii]